MNHYNSVKATEDEFPPPPGKWRACKRDGELGATFACPDCQERGGVGPGTNHTIAEDGEVQPSIVCDCGFHRHIYLDGWTP